VSRGEWQALEAAIESLEGYCSERKSLHACKAGVATTGPCNLDTSEESSCSKTLVINPDALCFCNAKRISFLDQVLEGNGLPACLLKGLRQLANKQLSQRVEDCKTCTARASVEVAVLVLLLENISESPSASAAQDHDTEDQTLCEREEPKKIKTTPASSPESNKHSGREILISNLSPRDEHSPRDTGDEQDELPNKHSGREILVSNLPDSASASEASSPREPRDTGGEQDDKSNDRNQTTDLDNDTGDMFSLVVGTKTPGWRKVERRSPTKPQPERKRREVRCLGSRDEPVVNGYTKVRAVCMFAPSWTFVDPLDDWRACCMAHSPPPPVVAHDKQETHDAPAVAPKMPKIRCHWTERMVMNLLINEL